MRKKSIRVLVVDDSPLLREMIQDAISSTRDMEVVGIAKDGKEAVGLVARVSPDVITMDVEMPRLNGLQALEAIMSASPVPVVMVSTLTDRGADATLEALQLGAVDYVAKPTDRSELERVFGGQLLQKIRVAATVDVHRILKAKLQKARRVSSRRTEVAASSGASFNGFEGCIAIGISTGGPPALARVFADLVPPLPPILVVQHMPPAFTKPFAARLDGLSELTIREAQGGEVLEGNHVYIAPGGKHMSLKRLRTSAEIVVKEGLPVSGHIPSVDVMMKSAAQTFGGCVLGAVMTGMGRDGSDGCSAIRGAGGFVVGQDQSTSAVYGMNRVAFEEGGVNVQVSLDEIAKRITTEAARMVRRSRIPAKA